MYDLIFAKDVVKFLKKTDKKVRKKVLEDFEILSRSPFDSSLNIKPLVNKKGHFRLRIGHYRFLYEVQNEILMIYCYKAGSRGDVYKGI